MTESYHVTVTGPDGSITAEYDNQKSALAATEHFIKATNHYHEVKISKEI